MFKWQGWYSKRLGANWIRKEELEKGVYGLSIIITMSTTSRTYKLPSKLISDATNSR